MATCRQLCSMAPPNVTTSKMKLPKVEVKLEDDGTKPLPGCVPDNEVFIDLTIESLRGSLVETIIDLTQAEDIPNLDLRKKMKVKSKEWWIDRRSSLRKLEDHGLYTEASLEICWPALARSKRFKKTVTLHLGSLGKPARDQEFIGLLGEEIIEMEMRELPFTAVQVSQTLSTLSSYTHRVYLMVDNSELHEDRLRAAFDTLAFPIFHRLETIFPKYINIKTGMLRVPRKQIPDLELLELSLLTLHRAEQFFQYFKFKPARMQLFYDRLDNDLKNIDTMIRMVQTFVEELGDAQPCRVKKEESSEVEASVRVKTENEDDKALVKCKLESESASFGDMSIKNEQTESWNVPKEEPMKCKEESATASFRATAIKKEHIINLVSSDEELSELETKWSDPVLDLNESLSRYNDEVSVTVRPSTGEITSEQVLVENRGQSSAGIAQHSTDSGQHCNHCELCSSTGQHCILCPWYATGTRQHSLVSTKTSRGVGKQRDSKIEKNAKKRVSTAVSTARVKRECPGSLMPSNMRAISECD